MQRAWEAAHDGEKVTGLKFLQKLPAIFFNFSRHGITALGNTIVRYLSAVQERYRERYAEAVQRAAAAAANQATAAAPSQERSGREKAREEGDENPAFPPQRTVLVDGLTFSLDPSRPDPSFSLIPFSYMDDERLLDAISDLKDNDQVNPDLVRGLEFGVGIHHGGLNKQYRTTVETLFRAKILQVVIATGTLAMGVHMPCRTVVMLGDSPHLDALNYRQMIGRSGRRGLDTLGHALFYGLSLHRVHRLRTSAMPRVHGQMLVTPTTTLRLLLLEEQLRLNAAGGACGQAATAATATASSRNGGPAVDMALKMVSEPFMAVVDAPSYIAADATDAAAWCQRQHLAAAGPDAAAGAVLPAPAPPFTSTSRQLMRHTLGLSLVYLLRNRMLDPATGRLRGLAGLATHLFWTEPANLVLCRLIHGGVFARLCKQLRGRELKDATMTLLAHLFIRWVVGWWAAGGGWVR
ncbi:hypothetical protein VOLCADRAFT_104129 [Volvox carteri f. nagariensis]|uniref:Helicase C-terminal domain-containing protein n=1 Tax=Volvox carteri f. nagariensis TaxID=3068 RepID=D8TRE6_VOLCA|nr:uncharacterized protein VOLCADRAFT_104129 [Volvox carteri f. nagariensis]EFJ49977.1 hypothetical protein VOLCADRAFT_104129 [Volvox carteri f. nagariensis]|eukprot:XP_002949042.1 hypothetical protein VOLCADRAFT_104129 [Volvox carteri f. nagariensis]